MNILTERWHRALQVRRSRRQFNSQVIAPDSLQHLENFCRELNTSTPGVRTVLINRDPQHVFKGAVGNYGKIKGAPAYAAFVGNMQDPHVQEKLGYMGEAFVLEATSTGLATCWVGGFFRAEEVAKDIELAPGECVVCVTPVGYVAEKFNREEQVMSNIASSHRRKDLAKLCTGLAVQEWPAWAHSALQAARLAPSAVNRQPWRFDVQERSITVSVDKPFNLLHISKRLDCGIAMLHLEVGALAQGVAGSWTFLDSPNVAVFCI